MRGVFLFVFSFAASMACLVSAADSAARVGGAAGDGRAYVGQNILRNVEFRRDGLGGVLNWTLSGEADVRQGEGPQGANLLRLEAKGGSLVKQSAMQLVPEAAYRFGAHFRTKGLVPGGVRMLIYNDNWSKSREVRLPVDTHGEWKNVEWRGSMISGSRFYFAIYADKPSDGGVIDFAAPYVEALSPKAAARSVPSPLEAPKHARIVPVDPLLSRLDASNAVLEFYYPGDVEGEHSRYAFKARIDGGEELSAPMDGSRRAKVVFGPVAEGRHELKVRLVDRVSGVEIAADVYPVRASAVKSGPAGRKLNNFVVELLQTPAADGSYRFFNPRAGWVYIGFDDPDAEGTAFIDGADAPAFAPRQAERCDTMRFLAQGWHAVAVRNFRGRGALVVRAVKSLVMSDSGVCRDTSDLDTFSYGHDFRRRYFYSRYNMFLGGGAPRRNPDSRQWAVNGARCWGEVRVPEPSPLWGDVDGLFRAITNYPGFKDGMGVAIDESSPAATRLSQHTLAEAAWRLSEGTQPVGIWWNNCLRYTCSDPRGQASMLSAVANSGEGCGLIFPEFYAIAYPDLKRKRAQEDHFVDFLGAIRRQVPCAANSMLLSMGGYTLPLVWCGWVAPDTDLKVLYDDIMYRFATDPACADVGGIGYTAIHRCDEEILRWVCKLVRHYAIEGRTQRLSSLYGFEYKPALLSNCDFENGFEGWSVRQAEGGTLSPTNLFKLGTSVQCRKMVPNGYGDSAALFVSGAGGTNVLSRAVKGFVPGKLYALHCASVDLDDLEKPNPCGDDITLSLSCGDGAEIVPELCYTVRSTSGRGPDCKGPWTKHPVTQRILQRIVFKALRSGTTISISDCDASGRVRVGARRVVNHVNLRPFYVEGERELAELKGLFGKAPNLVRNAEFRGDGIGGLLNWNLSGDAETVRGAGPEGQTALRLTSRNGRSLTQPAIWLVPGERYRFGAWVRTKGVKPNSVRFIMYNSGWMDSVSAGWLPSDTGGQWRKMEWVGEMLKSPAHNIALYQDQPIGEGVVEICAPYIEALSARGLAESRAAPLDVPRSARIVPIDPKLSRLDADAARVEFYYPGDLDSPPEAYVVSARIDGRDAVTARLDARRRARLAFGALAAGRHTLSVSIREAKSGRTVATDRYPVRAVSAMGSSGGRRLNNFAVELLRTDARNGEYVFNLPDDGWVYVSLDGAGRSAEARIDGGTDAVVRFRANEPMDAMRRLPAGRHVVALSGVDGGELRVNAVRPVFISPTCGRLKKTQLDRFLFGHDFYRRYLYHTFNTFYEFAARKGGSNSLEYEAYGLQAGSEIRIPETSPTWGSLEALSAAITNFVSFRQGFDLMIDESSPVVPRMNQWTLAETCWPLADGPQAVNIFWNNCLRNVCGDPRGQASMLSAVANSGGGRGWIVPETYVISYPDEARLRAQERHFGELLESIRGQVPCAADAVMFCFGGYLSPTGWDGYSAPETDMKVVYDRFLRNMAVDEAFRGVGGLGFYSMSRADEELLRWLFRCIRHYALRGETESLAERYRLKFRPALLANCDFAEGFSHWTPQPAEAGGLSLTNRPNFGVFFQGRKMIKPGPGDDLAVFKRSAKAPNRLSQKVEGLEPGRLYLFSCFSADPSDIAKPGPQGRNIGMHLSVDKGGVEIPAFAYTFACPENRLPDGRDRWSKRPVPIKALHRIVFRATAAEAVITISDWASPNLPGGEIGGLRIVNHCILRPYYVEDAQEFDALKMMYGDR